MSALLALHCAAFWGRIRDGDFGQPLSVGLTRTDPNRRHALRMWWVYWVLPCCRKNVQQQIWGTAGRIRLASDRVPRIVTVVVADFWDAIFRILPLGFC